MAWRLTSSTKSAAPPSVACSAAGSSSSTVSPQEPHVSRDYYLEYPSVAALSAAEVEALRTALGVRILGVEGSVRCPNPVCTFVQASFPTYLLNALNDAGFTAPTPIQSAAWPVALSGLDLVGVAQTGSGKTLAFLLPAIVHVNAQSIPVPGQGPLALVLAPTRELAGQIHEECVRFGHPCGVRSALIVGGVPKGQQIQALRKAPEVVVATPGRLLDLLTAKRTELSLCTYFVLDEADRMLDLGFEPTVRQLLQRMRADRQTMLFSATWPVEVQALAARLLLPDALTIEVGGALAAGGRANTQIEQRITVCTEAAKLSSLVALLEDCLAQALDGESVPRIMIFCSSKKRCEEVTRALRVDGWPALGIHGDKSQEEREWVLNEFKTGEQPLLVATDVAQRGLDIRNVQCVINFDAPANGESYVHRIGRSGRAGSKGSAHTLLCESDARVAGEILKILIRAKQPVPDSLERLAAGLAAES